MTVRGWTLALALVLVAVVMISGSRGLTRVLDEGGPDAVEQELRASLSDIETKLEALAALMPDSAATGDTALAHDPRRLLERHRVIAMRLDSMDGARQIEWRGALPGLRSAIADLEHRTDLAELAVTDTAEALDQLIAGWLYEMQLELDGIERDGDPARVSAYHAGLVNARAAHTRLVERAAGLGGHYTSADVSAKRSLAVELAELRRTVRALRRSISFIPEDTLS